MQYIYLFFQFFNLIILCFVHSSFLRPKPPTTRLVVPACISQLSSKPQGKQGTTTTCHRSRESSSSSWWPAPEPMPKSCKKLCAPQSGCSRLHSVQQQPLVANLGDYNPQLNIDFKTIKQTSIWSFLYIIIYNQTNTWSNRQHWLSSQTSNIDPSEALNMPGVVTFLSAGDVPGANRRLWFNNPEELFAEEEVLWTAIKYHIYSLCKYSSLISPIFMKLIKENQYQLIIV